jgi:hypothetical protein
LLSEEELKLIETIKAVEYGELYNVSVPDGPHEIPKELRSGNADLILFLRMNGYIDLPLVTVHCKEVKQIEVEGEKNGIKYKKRIRF